LLLSQSFRRKTDKTPVTSFPPEKNTFATYFSTLDDARRQIKRILNQSGLSREEVLKGIDEERDMLFGELYGR
jgi:hypothetical protein